MDIQDKRDIVKNHPTFKDVEVFDTWFEDIDKLRFDINERMRYLRRVKSERKKQPKINTVSVLLGKPSEIGPGYKIDIGKSGELYFIEDW